MKTKAKADLRMVPIRDVVVPKNRKRAAGDLEYLQESIERLGLINPITITKDMILVAGLHRLTACEILGWKQIPANVLSIGQLEAELVEIDENLRRTELTALERGEQTFRRKAIYEAQHPDTVRGVAGAKASNRKQNKGAEGDANAVTAFASNTAAGTGRSLRSVQEDAQIGEGIASSVADLIRNTPLADRTTELVALARIADPTEQAKIAALIVGGKAKTVAKAREQLATAAEGPIVVCDELDQEITDPGIAEVFTLLRPRVLEVASRLRAGHRCWGSFNDEHEQAKRIRIVGAKGYSYLRLNIERDVLQLARTIEASAPYALCPYCKGAPLETDRTKWCEGCRGGGWVTKTSYESAPPELKVQPGKGSPKRTRGAERGSEGVSHGS